MCIIMLCQFRMHCVVFITDSDNASSVMRLHRVVTVEPVTLF